MRKRLPHGGGGLAAGWLRVPLPDGTLVATPDDLIPGLFSDVLGTGWFGADAAAAGLCAVLASRQMGAERIIAMSRHEDRQKLALEFGATDIAAERGEEGVAKIRELTGGLGAHSVVEAVGIYNDFVGPLYFLPGTENVTAQLTLFSFMSQFSSQWNLLFADVLVITILPLIMFIFFQRQIVSGMTTGAIKG